ncbi:MAG: DUF6164 family protein [Pseudomonadota bacterium]
MPVRLFSLNGVPEDEADEVRTLLMSSGVDFYETPAGNWGISSPAIWLNDESELNRARSLIDVYECERQVKVREQYAQLEKTGKQRTVIDVIKDNPVRFIIYLAAIVVIVYLSTKPFMDFGK